MKKRIISLVLALALMLTVCGVTAYADGDDKNLADGYELRFDGKGWKAYAVDSKDHVLTFDEMNVTVVDRNGVAIDATAYDLSVEIQTGWDEANQCAITEPFTGELNIEGNEDPTDQPGFTGFCLRAIAKEGSGYTGSTGVQNFMIWHRYSFNWYGANATFGEEYARQCTWSWHDYFEIPVGMTEEPAVYGIALEEPIDPSNYTLTYFRRVTGIPVSDGDDYLDRVYPETDPEDETKSLALDGMPTEAGSYFVRIDGKAPYYGVSYIDFDIVVPTSYAFERSHRLDRYYDGETVYLPIDGELYLGFDLDPYNGMIPGWRNDLFTELGFEIDYDPTWFDGDSYAYAHIKAGSKQVGESGPLYYNWYDPADIFDEQGGMHWDTAEPVYSCSVNIEIVDAEEDYPVYILGDADGSGDVTILDATVIQRYLAALGTNNFVLLNADTNRNGDVDILDATRIQRYLAGFHDGTEIGEEVVYGTYFAMWNIEEELLPEGCELAGAAAEAARAEIRTALNLLVDRRAGIFSEIGRLPASTYVSRWITDADGNLFGANAGRDASFEGYYDTDSSAREANIAAAVEILKKYYTYDEASGKFTDVPALTYLHNNGEVHAAIAQQIKDDFGALGVDLTVGSKDWGTFQKDLGNKDYSLARMGWVVDYDDPMEFLTVWTSDNEENSVGLGQGAHADAAIYSLDLGAYGVNYRIDNGTWAQTYDVLIDEIDKCEDTATAYAMMHLAEDLLMSTGCVMPLYYY